jgi:hypothetical protein
LPSLLMRGEEGRMGEEEREPAGSGSIVGVPGRVLISSTALLAGCTRRSTVLAVS